MEDRNRKIKVISLAVLMSLFYLNDFMMMPVKNYLLWLLIDYIVRIAAVIIILFTIKEKVAGLRDFGLVKVKLRQGIPWSALLSVTGVAIDRYGWGFFKKILPVMQLSSFPVIKNLYVKIFDLTAGIALVSVTEELIFRAYFYTVMKSVIKNTATMIIVSSIAFGLIHWSLGLHAVVTTTLWGILPMYVMVRTGSVFPALIAHYVTDFIAFL